MGKTFEPVLDALIEEIAQRVAEKLGAGVGGAGAGAKEMYTVEDLAERYSLSRSAVRQRIQAGEFGKIVRHGTHCYSVTADGVRQYEQDHLVEAHAARAVQAPAAGRRSKARRDPGPI